MAMASESSVKMRLRLVMGTKEGRKNPLLMIPRPCCRCLTHGIFSDSRSFKFGFAVSRNSRLGFSSDVIDGMFVVNERAAGTN